MLYIPNDEMFTNRFVDVTLPTKSQIFARTGQHAVNPSGMYSGEDAVHFKNTPTSGIERGLRSIEEMPDKSEKSEK